MPEKTVLVPKIGCGGCVRTIEQELRELPEVELVEADAATKRVHVRWKAPLTWEALAATLAEIGFPAGDEA